MQEKTVSDLQAGAGGDTVFIVEHPSVITLGARSSANKLLKDRQAIENADIEIVEIRRGGGTTAHNPGQLVIYPIINLKKRSLGVSDFVHLLEKIGIELLGELGVKCETKKSLPGLWIGDKKIASIGVQVKKWITCHGIAININNDLSIFDLIVPCGLDNIIMTSAEKELGKKNKSATENTEDTEKIKGKSCLINMNNAKDILRKILLEKFV
jgi:lipoate-protein ligase B